MGNSRGQDGETIFARAGRHLPVLSKEQKKRVVNQSMRVSGSLDGLLSIAVNFLSTPHIAEALGADEAIFSIVEKYFDEVVLVDPAIEALEMTPEALGILRGYSLLAHMMGVFVGREQGSSSRNQN